MKEGGWVLKYAFGVFVAEFVAEFVPSLHRESRD